MDRAWEPCSSCGNVSQPSLLDGTAAGEGVGGVKENEEGQKAAVVVVPTLYLVPMVVVAMAMLEASRLLYVEKDARGGWRSLPQHAGSTPRSAASLLGTFIFHPRSIIPSIGSTFLPSTSTRNLFVSRFIRHTEIATICFVLLFSFFLSLDRGWSVFLSDPRVLPL